MGVTSDGKWYWVEPPDMPLLEAAEAMLSLRLADVQATLPNAADDSAFDSEAVHQLRVACRRAAAGLRAFYPLVGRGGQKLDRWLKRIRRAAGPARDADVLLARLRRELNSSDELARQVVRRVERLRASAHHRLVDVKVHADGGGLHRAARKCLKALKRSRKKDTVQSFAEFAQVVLASAAEDLMNVDVGSAAPAELHELRIAAKRVRYSIELFHCAASPALRAAAYPVIEQVQDRLGALNDRVTAQSLFQSWLADMPADEGAAFIAGLVVAERIAARRIQTEFQAWWLPERQSDLLNCLDAVAG